MFCQLVPEELDKIKGMVGDERFAQGNYRQSAQIFDRLASSERFVDFLTLAAYDWLP